MTFVDCLSEYKRYINATEPQFDTAVRIFDSTSDRALFQTRGYAAYDVLVLVHFSFVGT